MELLGFKKLKNLHNKHAGYFAMAGLVFFSVLVYSFFIYSPKVKAISTVGLSSSASPMGNSGQRHSVVSSNGTIIAFLNTGTQSVTGLAYSTSTDNGSTWGSATQVDSTQTNDFSVVIDGSDNIYLAFATGGTSSSINVRKLTYSAGSWSVGSANSVVAGTSCVSNSLDSYTRPSLTINSAGTVYVVVLDGVWNTAGCVFNSSQNSASYYSSNLTTWNSMTIPVSNLHGVTPVVVADGKSVWTVFANPQVGLTAAGLYADIGGTGTWALAASGITVEAFGTPSSSYVSMAYGLDAIHIFSSSDTGTLLYQSYTISTGILSAATTISSATGDVLGMITTDSQNLWVVYQSFVGASSYNVVYKRFNGTSWDGSSTAITTDNLNNTSINVPERMPSTANIPIVWNTGTGSPYTVKSAMFSTLGSATDSGNQTGSYSGSLTGSSGDILVKCGTWYYNTINIVSGMTVKVCSSNGQTGGNLTIYANSATVAGSIDGAGRGLPGGITLLTPGGIGGGGGAGTAGGPGISYDGTAGIGGFGGSAGSKGTSSASGGTAGTTSNGVSQATGGTGGGGASSSGTSGTLGGYLGTGINGDSSTDLSLAFGSGGGSGGTGGSGAGGGAGGNGFGTTPPNCAGGGGGGGNGGPGGSGGKGGNAGAMVKIITAGSLTVSGSITITGQAGGTGGSAGSAAAGSSGGAANSNC